jgi:hypothetical protein
MEYRSSKIGLCCKQFKINLFEKALYCKALTGIIESTPDGKEKPEHY